MPETSEAANVAPAAGDVFFSRKKLVFSICRFKFSDNNHRTKTHNGLALVRTFAAKNLKCNVINGLDLKQSAHSVLLFYALILEQKFVEFALS